MFDQILGPQHGQVSDLQRYATNQSFANAARNDVSTTALLASLASANCRRAKWTQTDKLGPNQIAYLGSIGIRRPLCCDVGE
jgi:hypothetical protein